MAAGPEVEVEVEVEAGLCSSMDKCAMGTVKACPSGWCCAVGSPFSESSTTRTNPASEKDPTSFTSRRRYLPVFKQNRFVAISSRAPGVWAV